MPLSFRVRPGPPPTRPLDEAALRGLTTAVTHAPHYADEDEPGWVNLAEVGNLLRKISPNLHAGNYGYERLSDFVQASNIIEWKRRSMGEHPSVMLVRLKRQPRYRIAPAPATRNGLESVLP